MKALIACMAALFAVAAFAQSDKSCCANKVAQAEKSCCASKVAAQSDCATACSTSKCATTAVRISACSKEDAFLAEAARMERLAEAKAKASSEKQCCKSTPEKPIPQGAPGCCNAPGGLAKFKVWVVGSGYKFYGCEGSARDGRNELMASGHRVGAVQRVTGRVTI